MNIDNIANGIIYHESEIELLNLSKKFGFDLKPGDIVTVKGFPGKWKLFSAMSWAYGEDISRVNNHVVLLKNKRIYSSITMKNVFDAIKDSSEFISEIVISLNDKKIELKKLLKDKITVPITWVKKYE